MLKACCTKLRAQFGWHKMLHSAAGSNGMMNTLLAAGQRMFCGGTSNTCKLWFKIAFLGYCKTQR